MVGAPDWAQALFNQMTMMLNRQEEIVQDVKSIKKEAGQAGRRDTEAEGEQGKPTSCRRTSDK
eukprot:11616157-Prorocentrum_lima.AAC.1